MGFYIVLVRLGIDTGYSAGLVTTVLGATTGGMLVSTGLKELFDRPRPGIRALHEVYTSSFPSGHSMAAATIYLTLASLLSRTVTRRREKVYLVSTALFLTFLVGFSRVFLGVHYPTDVLAGFAVGFAWAIFCAAGVEMLRKERPDR